MKILGLRRLAAMHSADRLWIMLLLSFGVHLALGLGVGFSTPEAKSPDKYTANLEVVLVNAKSSSAPLNPSALAQANLDGGGNTDDKRRAKSPLPSMKDGASDTMAVKKLQRVAELELQAKRLATQVKSEHSVETQKSKHDTPVPAIVPNAADLVQRSLDAARLEAQISREQDAYQQRPRRKYVGARTREYVYARYVEDWRAKVEKVGNLNYPEAAKDKKLYGSLQLTVSIRADGSVEKVEVNRSSGHKILDEAAIHIVQLAAPYAAFSNEMRDKTDILGITRTWMFTRGDQMTSGE